MGEQYLHPWLFSLVMQSIRLKLQQRYKGTTHVMFAVADHFEPNWRTTSYHDEVMRVDTWVNQYPKLARNHKDAEGKFPQYTFFFPAEGYVAAHLKSLAQLCENGFGEVEIHLHHNNDTSDGLKKKIEDYKIQLESHGLLSKDSAGKIRYGFIHGNWALNNSRRDGKWCGVNNELQILKDTGCYADFSLPSAPSDTQTRKINSIYYAKDNPLKRKSHNWGVDVEIGKEPSGDLMLIQGPLTLNWSRRKWQIFPTIENGEISNIRYPSQSRVDAWIKKGISVKGAPNFIFIKVHTHGCMDKNMEVLLGKPFDEMLSYMERKYNDGKNYVLHYVTTREMFNIIKAIESRQFIDFQHARDFLLKPIR